MPLNQRNPSHAKIAVQLTDDQKTDGHLHMALLMITITGNGKKFDAVEAGLEALLDDGKGLNKIAQQSGKTNEVAVCAVGTLQPFGYTAKLEAGEARTLVQSTDLDNRHASDYDRSPKHAQNWHQRSAVWTMQTTQRALN